MQLFRKLMGMAAIATAIAAQPAHAVQLNVTHFGTGMYGVPYVVAKDKGFYDELGIKVDGFLTSAGGGTTVRNLLASELPYGEVALPAAIAAIKQGLPLVIVHSGVASVSDLLWITNKDNESIKNESDLKGKKFGYSSPRSVTDMISTMMLTDKGLTGDVEKVSVGSIGSSLAALRSGAVDITYVLEPVWSKEKDNFRAVFNAADWQPRITQTVGVVDRDFLKKNPDLIKKLIEARRKGVEFIKNNPDQAAESLAKEYKIPLEQAKSAIKTVMEGAGGKYWSDGSFDYEGMEVMLKGLIQVGAVEPGNFNWSEVVEEAYLPEDLRSKGKK